jgi:hypothetical protein
MAETAMIQEGMTKLQNAVSQLSDRDLLSQVKVAAVRERDATARLIALLAEIDTRRLYLGEGCSSLFTYCTQVLHLSDYVARNIIRLMLLSALCEAGGRRGRLFKPGQLRSST